MKLFKNLFIKKAQLQVERKQVFQNFHDTSKESQRIISNLQEDVHILMDLTNELRVSKEKEIIYYDEILEHIDKLIAKQEGVYE